MMGERQTDHPALFYEFSLERHVPGDHLLRSIDRFVDLGDIREQLRPFYSDTGRPSIDPELMIRMLIVGYCMGIRSERRLCEEVHLNLAYRWFCRLGLDGAVPDHSTFSKNRHGRFRDSDLLPQAVRVDGRPLHRERARRRRRLRGRRVDDQGRRQPPELDARRRWEPPDDPGHAVREYLAVLDEAAFGGATPVVPKFISTADPASRWTGANGGLAFFAYSDQLSDRPGARRDRRRRGDHVGAAGRGDRRQADDRAHPGALRALARAPGRRHWLWRCGQPRLAGRGEGHRAAHPGVRQVGATRRHVRTSRLRLRPCRRQLHLPGRQALAATTEGVSRTTPVRR